MLAYQIPFRLFLVIIFLSVLNIQDVFSSPENNTFIIDNKTTIIFSIPNEKFYFSNVIDESTNIRDLKNISFFPFSEFAGFEFNKSYIKKIKIKNISNFSETISVMPGAGHLRSKFVLFSKEKVTSFNNDSGTNRNFLSSINPSRTSFQQLEPRNFTFKISPGDSIDLYYIFQMPSRGFAFDSRLVFFNTEKYQENRRFGLWLEGIIAGSLLALIIFTYYSYYQIRDKTTLYFCFWLMTAVLVIIGQIHHDGARLLEFFIDPVDDNSLFADISFSSRLGVLTGYIQAMMFVIFARQFIGLKKHHSIAFQFTNLYLVWYATHFFTLQFFEIEIDVRIILYPLVISTGLVLALLFYCAVQRYQKGMLLAKFFIIGFLPYLVFRIFGLLGVFFGFQSPFSYLPESGFQFFLNSSQVTQSVGLFIVAIVMSLVLAKRTKFLQDELNENIKKQADESERQQVVLEKTVEERTSELKEKSTVLEGISNQLAKYIPPQIHEALFEGKVNTEIKTRRRKLTVFFSDIKNFTSTSENMQPEDLTKYLNEYFSEMTKIAVKHGATIDKYIGDSMMVFFGDPETKGEKEDARTCIEMALEMQERMVELREKWLKDGFAEPFEIRMGVNTGYCNVGNFGSDQRLTYTIIGGEVNVAARLESVAEVNGLYMSYETYAHVQDMVEVEQKEAIKMKGINRDIRIYSVKERKKAGQEKAKIIRVTKPTKKELTEIEKLKEESKILKEESKKLQDESDTLKKELALIKIQLKKIRNT